jgi:transposase
LNAPDKPKPKALAQRFIDYPDGYFTFIDTPGVDPTNNLAERNFRFIALARLISQGSRSEQGRRARERLWTATVTCRRQKRSLFDYLTGALTAYCKGEAVPSLLPR